MSGFRLNLNCNATLTGQPNLAFCDVLSAHSTGRGCGMFCATWCCLMRTWTAKLTTGVWFINRPIHFPGCPHLCLSVTLPVFLLQTADDRPRLLKLSGVSPRAGQLLGVIFVTWCQNANSMMKTTAYKSIPIEKGTVLVPSGHCCCDFGAQILVRKWQVVLRLLKFCWTVSKCDIFRSN